MCGDHSTLQLSLWLLLQHLGIVYCTCLWKCFFPFSLSSFSSSFSLFLCLSFCHSFTLSQCLFLSFSFFFVSFFVIFFCFFFIFFTVSLSLPPSLSFFLSSPDHPLPLSFLLSVSVSPSFFPPSPPPPTQEKCSVLCFKDHSSYCLCHSFFTPPPHFHKLDHMHTPCPTPPHTRPHTYTLPNPTPH